jgi:hypothetical protein
MRAHVPAVGQKGHRAENRSAGDLDYHHEKGEHDHAAGGALAVAALEVKAVLVPPAVKRVTVHYARTSWCGKPEPGFTMFMIAAG